MGRNSNNRIAPRGGRKMKELHMRIDDTFEQLKAPYREGEEAVGFLAYNLRDADGKTIACHCKSISIHDLFPVRYKYVFRVLEKASNPLLDDREIYFAVTPLDEAATVMLDVKLKNLRKQKQDREAREAKERARLEAEKVNRECAQLSEVSGRIVTKSIDGGFRFD